MIGLSAWRGVAWRGVAWRGVVWCGVVWCGVVWCLQSPSRAARIPIRAWSLHLIKVPDGCLGERITPKPHRAVQASARMPRGRSPEPHRAVRATAQAWGPDRHRPVPEHMGGRKHAGANAAESRSGPTTEVEGARPGERRGHPRGKTTEADAQAACSSKIISAALRQVGAASRRRAGADRRAVPPLRPLSTRPNTTTR